MTGCDLTSCDEVSGRFTASETRWGFGLVTRLVELQWLLQTQRDVMNQSSADQLAVMSQICFIFNV